MRPDFCLGIDPGLSGALALLRTQDKSINSIFDMPIAAGRVDPAKLAGVIDMCKLCGSIHAAVELVQSRPRQSGSHAFGVSVGIVYGVLGALSVPMELIPASAWKPAMGLRRLLNESQTENKSRARALAVKLWPESAELFRRVKDHDRSEAALLARYYCTKLEGLK